MKKYLTLIKNAWQRQLVYRATIYGYRLGNIVDVLFQVAIWTAVYKSTDLVYGYNYPEMLSYVLVAWLMNFLTANYGMEDVVARHIQRGELNSYLTKPFSYLRYLVTLSFGRVSVALISGVVLQLFFLIIFHDRIIVQLNPFVYIIIIAIAIFGYLIRLFLSILFGLLSFWVVDVSGLNHFFGTFIRFVSGGYAPLSLLPSAIYNFSMFFPFAYIIFFPTQIYLGKISLISGVKGILVQAVWLMVLYVIIKIVWKRGLKRYEGVGI